MPMNSILAAIIDPFSLSFMINALLTGIMIATLASQVGIFVVGRKLAFLGDTLSHAAFTGIAFGIALGISPNITVFLLAIIIALILTWLQERAELPSDTYIAILYSSLLALGIMVVSTFKGYRVELFQYLFGDILAISQQDLFVTFVVTIIVLLMILTNFRKLTMIVIDRDIAHTKGVNVRILNYIFVLLLALTTAVTIKIIGVLLLSALLIIPSASALIIARNLRSSLLYSFIIAEIMVITGLILSYHWDTPSGPTMIIVGSVIFVLSNVYRLARKN